MITRRAFLAALGVSAAALASAPDLFTPADAESIHEPTNGLLHLGDRVRLSFIDDAARRRNERPTSHSDMTVTRITYSPNEEYATVELTSSLSDGTRTTITVRNSLIA
jgi:hypothetical protein